MKRPEFRLAIRRPNGQLSYFPDPTTGLRETFDRSKALVATREYFEDLIDFSNMLDCVLGETEKARALSDRMVWEPVP